MKFHHHLAWQTMPPEPETSGKSLKLIVLKPEKFPPAC